MEVTMDDERQSDNTDAKGIFGLFPGLKPRKGKYKDITEPNLLQSSYDSDEYFMDFSKRGKCLIFNHKKFDPHTKLNVRNGTDADAARLYCRFRELGFDTELFTDLTVGEVNNKLKAVGKQDHSDFSCFVCCVLSHGEYGILFARDGKYETDNVFAPFRGDACPSLVGKPKLFFIQACQGDNLDPGVEVVCNESADSITQFKIPTHADFLIVYSTVPGFYSWRNTTNGSWFIQSLCAALQQYGKEKDLLSILTIVNRRVAFDFVSYTPQDSSMHLKKQVPLITSTLTRDIKFKK